MLSQPGTLPRFVGLVVCVAASLTLTVLVFTDRSADDWLTAALCLGAGSLGIGWGEYSSWRRRKRLG